MTRVAIPFWNADGVIPPTDSTESTGPERSPYVVALTDLVSRFATSDQRRGVLGGFLRYRGRLHEAGLTAGFQWINGSFLEEIERLEGRAPNDLDVVTFFHPPEGFNQADLRARFPDVFPATPDEKTVCKRDFFVDPYYVNLGLSADRLVRRSVYWYSMWSHRRDKTWKGYLQIDLAAADEDRAASLLIDPPSGETP